MKKLVSLLLVLSMTLCLMTGLCSCGSKTIKLQDYYTLTIAGSNGYFTGESADLDKEAFIADLAEEIRNEGILEDYISGKLIDYENLLEDLTVSDSEEAAENIEDYISKKLTYNWTLNGVDKEDLEGDSLDAVKNGDVVTVTVEDTNECMNNLEKYYGIKVDANVKLSETVKGLPEVIQFNPMDYIKLSITKEGNTLYCRVKPLEKTKIDGVGTIEVEAPDNDTAKVIVDFYYYVDETGEQYHYRWWSYIEFYWVKDGEVLDNSYNNSYDSINTSKDGFGKGTYYLGVDSVNYQLDGNFSRYAIISKRGQCYELNGTKATKLDNAETLSEDEMEWVEPTIAE